VNPEILALARRITYTVDPTFPGPERFKGAVAVTLRDGRRFFEVEEHNRGSVENPMSRAELTAKFKENARGLLSPVACDRLVSEVDGLDTLADAARLVDLAVPATEGARSRVG
jgi:2-methylcitrate dehydratase PrpD